MTYSDPMKDIVHNTTTREQFRQYSLWISQWWF